MKMVIAIEIQSAGQIQHAPEGNALFVYRQRLHLRRLHNNVYCNLLSFSLEWLLVNAYTIARRKTAATDRQDQVAAQFFCS